MGKETTTETVEIKKQKTTYRCDHVNDAGEQCEYESGHEEDLNVLAINPQGSIGLGVGSVTKPGVSSDEKVHLCNKHLYDAVGMLNDVGVMFSNDPEKGTEGNPHNAADIEEQLRISDPVYVGPDEEMPKHPDEDEDVEYVDADFDDDDVEQVEWGGSGDSPKNTDDDDTYIYGHDREDIE